MKKRTLKEELERIHSITYGKKILMEDNLLTKLLQGGGSDDTKPTIDDPSKADYVNDNVKKFLTDLKSINEPITQQKLGTMQYQKNVELVQIGLVLLGYELPIHGIDGLFGPETADAVRKYKTDNNTLSEEFIPGIDEMVWNKMPWGLNDGEKVDGINWSGHDTHIHFGFTDPQVALKVIEKCQELGLTAIENPYLNEHVDNSFHYKNFSGQFNGKTLGQGLDVSGDPKKMEELFNWVSTELGHGGSVSMNTPQSNTDSVETVSPDMIQTMASKLELKGVTKEQLDKLVDKIATGGGDVFTDLDLTTEEGVAQYAKICDLFIRTRQPNPLGITGKMLSEAAKNAFTKYHKYVPPELALAQLTTEGGIGDQNIHNVPVSTRNPFDVANTETSSKTFPSVQDGINAYYDLIARRYLGNGKTSNDLIYNFVNKDNQRYASSINYEKVISSIAKQVNMMAKNV